MKRKRHRQWVYIVMILLAAATMHVINDWKYQTDAQTPCIQFEDTVRVQWGYRGNFTDGSTSAQAIQHLTAMPMIKILDPIPFTHRPVDFMLSSEADVIGRLNVLFSDFTDLWYVQQVNADQQVCGTYLVEFRDIHHFLRLMGG